MRIFGASLAVALVAVGCGGAIPSAPDTAVMPAQSSEVSAQSAKRNPRVCAVQEVVLTAERATEYRNAYRVAASYVMADTERPCGAPVWRLDSRTGSIQITKDPYSVYVQSPIEGLALTINATAPNGRSASQELKF